MALLWANFSPNCGKFPGPSSGNLPQWTGPAQCPSVAAVAPKAPPQLRRVATDCTALCTGKLGHFSPKRLPSGSSFHESQPAMKLEEEEQRKTNIYTHTSCALGWRVNEQRANGRAPRTVHCALCVPNCAHNVSATWTMTTGSTATTTATRRTVSLTWRPAQKCRRRRAAGARKGSFRGRKPAINSTLGHTFAAARASLVAVLGAEKQTPARSSGAEKGPPRAQPEPQRDRGKQCSRGAADQPH